MVHAELYFPMEKRARFHVTNESLSAIFQYGGSGAVFSSRYTASCHHESTRILIRVIEYDGWRWKIQRLQVRFNICSPVIVAYLAPRADEQCKLVRHWRTIVSSKYSMYTENKFFADERMYLTGTERLIFSTCVTRKPCCLSRLSCYDVRAHDWMAN